MQDSTTSHHDYTYDELAKYFHMPINDVSQELGICATLLKKICRKNGINRWPHRKIKSLDKMIEAFELLSKTEPDDFDSISNDIQELKEKRDFLLKNPNVSYNSVLPKHCVNAYNARIQKTGHLIESKRKELIKPTKTIKKASLTRYPRRSLRNLDKPMYQEDGIDSSGDEEYISPDDENQIMENLSNDEDMENNLPHVHDNHQQKITVSPSSCILHKNHEETKNVNLVQTEKKKNEETFSTEHPEEESAACLLVQLHNDIWHSKTFQNSHLPSKFRWKQQQNGAVQEFPSQMLKNISDFINSPLTV